MSYQNYLIDVVDVVLGRNTWDIPDLDMPDWDISDEAFVEAVKDQACLMARINPEEIRGVCSD